MYFLILATFIHLTTSETIDDEKIQFCKELNCDDEIKFKVCGLRYEGEGVRLKSFESICDLMKYGCSVSAEETYGLVKLDLCEEAFTSGPKEVNMTSSGSSETTNVTNEKCPEIDCSYPGDDVAVCGIREFESGFKVRIFKNKCKMFKHNCDKNVTFIVTDLNICIKEPKLLDNLTDTFADPNYLIVINGSMLLPGGNFNESIENFFASTHTDDIPLMESETYIMANESGPFRRSFPLTNLKPKKILHSWAIRPNAIKNDSWHMPLLNTCFHKCPIRCPDTYNPVCGFPGNKPRVSTMMFRNHCFMDAAQCRIYRQRKNQLSKYTQYVSANFVFCFGDKYGSYLRLMPVIRSLQRMHRIRKPRHKQVIKHFRNFYNLLPYDISEARGK